MPRWMDSIFFSKARRLRNGWWIAAFLPVLALLLFPAILALAHWGRPLAMPEQALIIAIATTAIQKLRRRPVFEVVGRLGRRWTAQLAVGAVLGAALMAAPALFLTQGIGLGFGVSGTAEPSLLTPLFSIERDWLTGGAFGLEGSLPGLIAIVVLLAAFALAARERSAPRASRIVP